MLKVRLQRTGKRGQAYFRVVVVEHTKKPRGEFLELLGNYDPHKKELNVKMDRVDYWISKGAQASPTVNNLLVNYKYWDKPKMQSWKPKTTETQKNHRNAEGEEKTETSIAESATAEAQKQTEKEETKTGEQKIEPPVETTAEQRPAEELKQEEAPAGPQPTSTESFGEANPETRLVA